jgi:hypothetical protein
MGPEAAVRSKDFMGSTPLTKMIAVHLLRRFSTRAVEH